MCAFALINKSIDSGREVIIYHIDISDDSALFKIYSR